MKWNSVTKVQLHRNCSAVPYVFRIDQKLPEPVFAYTFEVTVEIQMAWNSTHLSFQSLLKFMKYLKFVIDIDRMQFFAWRHQ